MNLNVFPSEQYCYKYPHPALTADCCVFSFLNNELSLLLVRRGIEPFKGQWAVPGGFMRMNETAEQCAKRELSEETGFVVDKLRQVGAFSEVDRDPRERVVTVAFYALVKPGAVRGGDDADEARWFPVTDLPPLAFDHDNIVHEALMTMRRDIYFEPIGFDMLPPTFTMPELQKIIEAITGNTYDRRNFYNKMRHFELVEEVPQHLEMPREGSADICFSAPGVLDEAVDDINDCSVLAADRFVSHFACPKSEPEPEPELELEPEKLCRAEPEPLHITAPERKRRSGVRYFFNGAAFRKRKAKNGSEPFTF